MAQPGPIATTKCARKGCRASVVQPIPPGRTKPVGRARKWCSPACKYREYRRRRAIAWKWGAASVQWYTPPALFERIARDYGPFDLDPCADERSPIWPLVPHHWTLADDGLAQPWIGRVFCNPPYGRGVLAWVDHAADEIDAQRAGVVVLLVPAKTDTAWWWRALERGAEPVFLRGRVRFVLPSGEVKQGAGFPSALLVFRGARRATKGDAP